MDAMEAAGDSIIEVDSPVTEEFVFDSLEMIFNNYRSIVECKGESFNICHLADIMKAFALYLYGTDLKRISIIPPRLANQKLFDALSHRGVELDDGFHSWRSVSTVVQGMQMMSIPITIPTFLRTFSIFIHKLSTSKNTCVHLDNVLLLRDSVNEDVSDTTLSDDILVPWFTLTHLKSLYDQSVAVPDTTAEDLKRLLMLIIGAQFIDRPDSLSLTSDGHPSDAVLFLTQTRGVDATGILQQIMDSLPQGGNLVLVTDSVFNFTEDPNIKNARALLKNYRIECQYRINRWFILYSSIPLFITKIVKSEPDGCVALINRIEGLETRVDQSKFDWNMDMLLHKNDFKEVPSIQLDEIADLRKGVIVPRSELTEDYDAERPVLVRPMDISNGRIKERDTLLTIISNRHHLVKPGTILVYSRGFFHSAIVSDGDSPCVASSTFTLVSSKGEYSREYLLAFFKSSYFFRQAFALSASNSLHLTIQSFSVIKVPIATKDQQKAVSKAVLKMKNPDRDDVWKIFVDKLKLQIPQK